MAKLIIKNLHASVEDKEILKGVDLEVSTGEFHVIMGPNGTGKSTLSSVIMGHPRYTVTSGTITLDGEDVLEMSVDERAKAGLFLAMQYPSEVPGVTNSDFVKTAMKATSGKDIPLFKFIKDYEKSVEELKMNKDLPHRYLNEGFSGGEKKRNEILQLMMLKPKIAILDEIDSGLDVDALKIVGENIQKLKSEEFGCLMITHYQRLLEYIKPDIVHIMLAGKIAKTGDHSLIEKIDNEGYDFVKKELGIVNEKAVIEEKKRILVENCATKERIK